MLLDLKLAVRQLLKNPAFSAVTLLTLALCIGANTAIFSMVNALLLRPLPFPEPTRIVEIYNTFHKAGLDKMPSNLVQYDDYKHHAASFDSVGLLGLTTAMVGEEGRAERVNGAYGTAEMFDILGLKPVIGQVFTLRNSQVGEEHVVVITESYWRSQYHADPAVLGAAIRMDGETYHIIGVVPDALDAFDARMRFFRPMSWKADALNPQGRFACYVPLFAHLKPGVSAGQALGEALAIEKLYYDAAVPGFKQFLDRAGHRIAVGLVQAEKVQPIRSSLVLLEGGAVFVLLIGCVNIANLLLTRANGRQGELAVRTALGASRWAIARQLLTESLVLTLTGAVLGVALAWTGIRVINRFSEKLLPNMLPFAVDGRVLAFALALSVVVGLLIGVLPVIHTLRSDLMALIHRSSRSVSGSRGVRALSSVLVTGQVAVALVLLVGAGLLIHSFANALSVKPGFDPANVVTGHIAVPKAYQTPDAGADLQRRIVAGMRQIPDVDSVALATGVPFQGGLGINALTLKENTLASDSSQPGAFQVGASVGYFQALRIPLLEGRFFDDRDPGASPATYVVDENFEKKYFPGASAVGKHFTFGQIPKTAAEWPVIIGVVRNVPHNGVEDRSNQPFIYYPMLKTTPGELCLFVRSGRPTADLAGVVRAKLQEVDPTLPLFDTGTLEAAIGGSFDNRRAVMLLLGSFAALALFLSMIGIYGVLAYDVSQRTREIGVRGAIGASRGEIIGLVMRQGIWKTAVGLAIGLVSAALLSHFMASMLFDLKPTDPWAYVVVSLLLAGAATLASYLPARAAAGIEPTEALRFE
jgi:putative ABC transport system permease protein